jgi:hypothetical protein
VFLQECDSKWFADAFFDKSVNLKSLVIFLLSWGGS